MRSINLFQFTSDTLPYAFCEQIGKEIRDISDEIPFEIPDSWEWVRLGFIGNWGSGATPSRTNKEYYDGNIPWLKTGDLNDGIITDIPEKITELALEKTSVRLNPVGSVLIAMYGATIGKLGILNIPATTNQACCACLPILVNNNYLFYFLMSHKESFTKKAEGGAQPNISKEKIISTLFPLPPLAEQKRIVAKIEELLPYIEKYEQAETKLTALNKSFPEMLKKSILQEAVQGKLVPQNPDDESASVLLERIRTEKQELIKQGKIKKSKHESIIVTRDKIPYEIINGKERCIADEVPFEIPESWEWCRLTELSSVITKGSSPKWQGITYVDEKNGILFITSENIGKEKLLMNKAKYVEKKFNDMHSTSILKFGDILTNIVGASIGRTAIYNLNSENSNINQAVCIIRLINLDFRMYIIKFLNSPIAFQMMTNNSVDSARANLSLSSVSNFLIPLPPLAEQKRIVKKIEELMPMINSISK